jgi:hypothetical protein
VCRGSVARCVCELPRFLHLVLVFLNFLSQSFHFALTCIQFHPLLLQCGDLLLEFLDPFLALFGLILLSAAPEFDDAVLALA